MATVTTSSNPRATQAVGTYHHQLPVLDLPCYCAFLPIPALVLNQGTVCEVADRLQKHKGLLNLPEYTSSHDPHPPY